MGRGFVLFLMAFPEMGVLIAVSVAATLLGVGIGIVLLPNAVYGLRRLAGRRRRLAGDWQGLEIPDPYRPRPEFKPGAFGYVQRCLWMLTDPASWRDLAWSVLDPIIGATSALIPLTLVLYGVYGFVIAAFWRVLTGAGFNDWYTFVHVSWEETDSKWATMPVGAVFIVLGFLCAPAMFRLNGSWTRVLLAPTASAGLAQRVQHLTETRTDAVDTQAAEIRRIERDLHDGAQARLVAMGMNLNTAAKLLEKNPEAAKTLLLEARDASAKALAELRDLVRGIHPPVLADRGLGDAVRALALDSALNVEVTVDLPGRLQAPLESAAYFAIGEVLTNAAKHSDAHRVWIEIRHEDGKLHMSVTDDGVGGANPSDGTGLRGIERRLATFDGIIAVSSPLGGPTVVTMELPCVLSSPKTSSSSGTG